VTYHIDHVAGNVVERSPVAQAHQGIEIKIQAASGSLPRKAHD
jgi:hypothetical protein